MTTILDSQKKLTLSLSLINLTSETRPFSLMSEGIEGTVPGIVKLMLTKCEMMQYRVSERYQDHNLLRSCQVVIP